MLGIYRLHGTAIGAELVATIQLLNMLPVDTLLGYLLNPMLNT